MLGNYNSKNDGYIKNQNIKLNEARKIILIKIAVIIVPLVFLIAFLWFVFGGSTSPEKWTEKQITYETIARNYMTRYNTGYVIKTAEGKQYVIAVGTEDAEQLSQKLVKGQQYKIIYYHTPVTMITCSLSSDGEEFISIDESIEKWKNNQKSFYVILAILLVVMISGCCLSFLLWCREERLQIMKIKQKIAEREAKRLNSHK